MNIENAVNNLEKRGFYVSQFDTKEAARDYLTGKLNGQTIGFGGSVTLKEMGLFEALSVKNTVWNHWVQDPQDARKNAAQADIYITSANSVAETGEIINIDGAGNRIAATLYGKKKCISSSASTSLRKTTKEHSGAPATSPRQKMPRDSELTRHAQ